MNNKILILIATFFLITLSCKKNSCNNNVKDGNETNIDCGGDCVSCCSGNGIFIGEMLLTTQEQVDSFGALHYNEIKGKLKLTGSDITSINSLCSIKKVDELDFYSLGITDLTGLENIDTVETIHINNCNLITNIDEFSNIKLVKNYINFIDNNNLLNVDGLNNASSDGLQGLLFQDNNSLVNINGIENIKVSILSIIGNNSLSILPDFKIVKNPIIIIDIQNYPFNFNLDFLSNIDDVLQLILMNNQNLTDISVLGDLSSIEENLTLTNNINLSDFCSLQNLISNNGLIEQDYNVSGNQFNPSFNDIINGDCMP